jgi:VanZ family protein
MAFVRRKTAVVAALALYWPALFVVAHIPVPQVVRRAHVSDKGLHLLAYMVLTFLLWSAVKPYQKVRWRKAAVWAMLAVIAVYGICDEWLQHYVADRSMDPRDLLADMAGAVAAMGILTVFSFWPASVIIAGTAIYALAVLTRANLTSLLLAAMTILHLVTHAVFTFLWMGCVRWSLNWGGDGRLRLVPAVSLPLALVLVTKASAMISGKAFEGWDMIAAVAGILGAVAVVWAIGRLGCRSVQSVALPPADG